VTEPSAREYLKRATEHLKRVRLAWDPPDWSDLSLDGFYALEAAVMAAGEHFDWKVLHTHPSKVEAAERLHRERSPPDVADLLRELNRARMAVAYGDIEFPDLDAGDVASGVENYVQKVAQLVGG
jgi:hypothetical protein